VVDIVTVLGLEHSRGRHGARYAIVAIVRRLRGCVWVFSPDAAMTCTPITTNIERLSARNGKTAMDSLKYTLHANRMATAQP
jgi:hypothetical protein